MRSISALVFAFLSMAFFNSRAIASDLRDGTPRNAIIAAFEPELRALQSAMEQTNMLLVNGTVFHIGTLEGRPVVLFLSGVSMVNAAMTAQLVLDHFSITRMIFSGIAGGADPTLEIGDVVIPSEWAEYLESIFARERNGEYVLPGFADKSLANFGMIFPQPVEITRGAQRVEPRWWFQADANLLSVAGEISHSIKLESCTADQRCLPHEPKVLVGGNGVSGQAFVDNAAFREYAYRTFHARVIDMESAAVAHVSYVNEKPFIAFRSLSDLAGGGQGENEEEIFLNLAAENSAKVVEHFLRALP
jgi:adenosylhomocysteine nucleosidase